MYQQGGEKKEFKTKQTKTKKCLSPCATRFEIHTTKAKPGPKQKHKQDQTERNTNNKGHKLGKTRTTTQTIKKDKLGKTQTKTQTIKDTNWAKPKLKRT